MTFILSQKLDQLSGGGSIKKTGKMPANFLRHYYDVSCLLDDGTVQEFIGTEEYQEHKKKRFPTKDQELPLSKQEAFLLKDTTTRELFEKEYKKTSALYYQGQILLSEIMDKVSKYLDKL